MPIVRLIANTNTKNLVFITGSASPFSLLTDLLECLRTEPFKRNAEPIGSFLPILEDTDVDRRALRQHRMQPAIMNDGRIGSQDR